MQPGFWHERWRLGQIGFHQTAVDRQLTRHWAALRVIDGAVFVPLCGKSLDLLWLRNQGLRVTGVELSAVALESLCWEHGILVRRSASAAFDRFDGDGLRLYCGDVFDITGDMLGNVRAVYDRAALIAISPDARARYVEHLTALTEPGTRTLLITAEYAQHETNGPPFSVSMADVEQLYGPHYGIQVLSRREILAEEPRLRARGVTELHENCFLLTRR